MADVLLGILYHPHFCELDSVVISALIIKGWKDFSLIWFCSISISFLLSVSG